MASSIIKAKSPHIEYLTSNASGVLVIPKKLNTQMLVITSAGIFFTYVTGAIGYYNVNKVWGNGTITSTTTDNNFTISDIRASTIALVISFPLL